MKSTIQIGQVVRSNCGRDMDKIFIVVNTDKDFVYLVDGKLRTITNPKKKRSKHISPTDIILEDIRTKILTGTNFYNKEVKRRLQEIQDVIELKG